jgi:hypothetical protein
MNSAEAMLVPGKINTFLEGEISDSVSVPVSILRELLEAFQELREKVDRLEAIDLSDEAYSILEAGAYLSGLTLKDLASKLVISGSSLKSKELAAMKLGCTVKTELVLPTQAQRPRIRGGPVSRLTPDLETKIIDLWVVTEHNRSAISRELNLPNSNVRLWVRRLIKEGKIEA